ncbi:MAG: outer membrane beta-barrel protein [Gammaproteobacteria bacterium]|nr:outer membrane beta-barrel protein [Gammaproteobacteria bacterium]
MQKKILFTCLTVLLPLVSFAAPRPVVTLSLGSDRTNVYSTKSITLIPPFQNSYLGTNHYDTEGVIALFAGAESAFCHNWAVQYGLSYFQSSSFGANGNVYQFSDPAFNNLTYQYQIQSRRLYFESKLSPAIQKIWHPYVSAGVGGALNKAYAYIEKPLTSDAVPMAQPFGSHNTKSFTYMAGLGVDVDLGEHVRAGIGYRFADLGHASLGVTPLQSSTNTISNTHLHTNEYLVQFSYVG